MKKVVIITGLTCSGKSELAFKLAKQFNGEIISADSVQIYKGLNIGSAKVDAKYRKIIPHHLIDIRAADESYNVNNFVLDCQKSIDCIFNKNKTPFIVGGTGLYVKALISGYTFGGLATSDNREKYEKLAAEKGNEYVWQILNKINPNKAKSVHPNNIKRVIRYIEIEQSGETPNKSVSILNNIDYLAVGIIDDRDTIYGKINDRVDKMINAGLQSEVKTLINSGAKRNWQSMTSIGYKEWFDFFEGKTDLNTTVDLIKQHTRNYCKRQLTFLKTMPELKLCTIDEAEKLIKEFLNDQNKK